MKTRQPLGTEPGNPPMSGLPGNAQLLGHVRDGPVAVDDPLDQQATTTKVQTSISVTHGDLLLG